MENICGGNIGSICENTDNVTEADILIGFFEFYGFTFDRLSNAIDIRGPNPGNKNEILTPYRPRVKVIEEAIEEFARQTNTHKGFELKSFDKQIYYQFLVVDPFNRTYNAAKVKAESETA